MSRRAFGHTSAAPRQRCLRRGCEKWEFEKGLCKGCIAEGGAVLTLASMDWEVYKSKPPIATGLVVVATLEEPHFLVLREGDYVDVLEWQAEKNLAVCRTAAEAIGFYSIPALKTEEQIFAEFRDHEDVELVMELENKEQAERDAEAAYDAQLRQRMKDKAEADVKRRAQEAEERKLAAEERLKEFQEREAWEAEQKKLSAAESARKRRDREAREMVLHQNRVAEAHAEKRSTEITQLTRQEQKAKEAAAWEKAEKERKDNEYLASLPQWKRDVVLRKRAQQGGK